MKKEGQKIRTPFKEKRQMFFQSSKKIILASFFRLGVAFCPVIAVATNTDASSEDLTQFSLEQLVNLNVYSASKFVQKVSDAPSAVTIITAADIKTYGYRKLVDILKSIRGIYGRYDRNYDFIGLRGFGRPGDYNSRFLLLLDGYRINDTVYDTATVGTEFLLDVDLIDRVEFVPGPGSSIYGSNAFFGVVNVITRTPKNVDSLEASLETASYNANKARLTYGRKLDNGVNVMFSGSFLDSTGRDLYFKEFDTPATNGGVASGLDYDHYGQFFTKLSYNAFTLTAAYAERKKGVPTGAYGTPFNDSNTSTLDTQAFIDLQYYQPYQEKLDVMARIYYGYYPYDGTLPYVDGSNNVIVNHDQSRSKWWGSEVKFVSTQFNKHKLVYGAEFRNNVRQDQSNFDDDPNAGYSQPHHSKRYGLYVQDEYSLRENWIINLGLRYDKYGNYGNSDNIVNPRLGLIYKRGESDAFKLLYGTAFRAPNAYELYYQTDLDKPNPNLKPEKIKTYDLIWEKYYGSHLRLVTDIFHYKIRDLIDSREDPLDNRTYFDNVSSVEANGVEFEIERHWDNAAKIRVSMTWQQTEDKDTGAILTNSPKVLAKLNATFPIVGAKLHSGLEVQYIGRRNTTSNGSVGGYSIANLTLLTGQWIKNTDLSVSIYNLLDKRYADPGGTEVSNTSAGIPSGLDSVYQDGRNFRFKLTYRF